jgi:hypothetical protein
MLFAEKAIKFFTEILTDKKSQQIWIVHFISLNFALAKDNRRERHRSLLHFPE